MKPISHLFLITITLCAISCSLLQETFSGPKEAQQAFHLNDAHVRTYKFNDLLSLKLILNDFLNQYQMGLSALKKEARTISIPDRAAHERRLTLIEREMRIIEAHVDNFPLLYADEWVKEKESLDGLFDELYQNYREAYLKLYPVP